MKGNPLVVVISWLFTFGCEAGLIGGHFASGEGSTIRDLAALSDGSVVACGSLGADATLPVGVDVHALLPGTTDSGDRGFVCAWTPDLSTMRWIAVAGQGGGLPHFRPAKIVG